jgi:hypothetical protein
MSNRKRRLRIAKSAWDAERIKNNTTIGIL